MNKPQLRKKNAHIVNPAPDNQEETQKEILLTTKSHYEGSEDKFAGEISLSWVSIECIYLFFLLIEIDVPAPP